MEALISGILEEKINEIFKEMQERFNIKYGDVDPLDEYELMDKKIEMSVLIGKILRKQRGEKQPMIKYKDLLNKHEYQKWSDIDCQNTYWSSNGKHQEKYDAMCKENFEFSKTAVSLFHRYYRFFNDGDCPSPMKHLVVDYSKYLEEKVDDQIEKEWRRFIKKITIK